MNNAIKNTAYNLKLSEQLVKKVHDHIFNEVRYYLNNPEENPYGVLLRKFISFDTIDLEYTLEAHGEKLNEKNKELLIKLCERKQRN